MLLSRTERKLFPCRFCCPACFFRKHAYGGKYNLDMPRTGWQPTCRDLTSPPCSLPFLLGAATETDLISCRGWHSCQLSTDVDKTHFLVACLFSKSYPLCSPASSHAYRSLSDFWPLNLKGTDHRLQPKTKLNFRILANVIPVGPSSKNVSSSSGAEVLHCT